jgi:putative transposase
LRVAAHLRDLERFDWVGDNLNTPSRLALCQVTAYRSGVPFVAGDLQALAPRRAFLSDPEHKQVFHYLPAHGSWLNQIERWFSSRPNQ